ncbi:MAG: DUF5666 domain-containing protein [Dehalococcoidia bacterium]
MALTLLVAIACTPSEAALLKGILQNVDAVNGEITIVTKDGKTLTLTIATEAPVETDGASSALETLEPGTTVGLELDEDGQVVRRIEARQAKVEGIIVRIEGNQITVETARDRTRTVTVTDRTRIELEDDFPGVLGDLGVGQQVEVKFDIESLVVFKIDTEEEEAEIEGVVVQLDGGQLTIETERGRRLTLAVGDRTRIEVEDDLPGTYADLQVGVEVEVKFDPFTRTAFKIELEEEEAEIEGVVVGVNGEEITIETDGGRRLTMAVDDRTRIELEDDLPGTYADLQIGEEVKVKFDPFSRTAFKIEVDD